MMPCSVVPSDSREEQRAPNSPDTPAELGANPQAIAPGLESRGDAMSTVVGCGV